jgi:hypothetical protein
MTDPIVVEVLNWVEEVVGEPVCYKGGGESLRSVSCGMWNVECGMWNVDLRPFDRLRAGKLLRQVQHRSGQASA